MLLNLNASSQQNVPWEMREIREAEKQSIRGLREDWKWIFSIEIRFVYTYPLSTGFDDSAVAESAYPERRAGFRPFLAPVPNKVVYEVQCHLDLRGVERFWGNDVNEMKEKKKKSQLYPVYKFFRERKKEKKHSITFQSLGRANELPHYFLEQKRQNLNFLRHPARRQPFQNVQHVLYPAYNVLDVVRVL